MEVARVGFGPKTLIHALKVPFCRKTNLSFSPPRLLPNQTLSNKQRKHCVWDNQSTSDDDLESTRPLTEFSPSIWGNFFVSLPVDHSEYDEIAREIESVMKPNVRDRLMSSHSGEKDKIRMIHLLISLGISHYFENEIEYILSQAFGKLDDLISKEDDLETVSIMFEVFRLYRHKMSCDAFKRFKGEDGRFKESVAQDVKGMLQLYQAAHLRTPSEDILEEAKSFTRNQLESLTVQEGSTPPPHLLTHIRNALYRARCHNMELPVMREYISFYDQDEGHDKMLLKFAKLNFNFCRLLYIQELKTLTKWWEELNLASKLPYLRDRIVEVYLAAFGIYFEPRYSLGRIITTRIIMVVVSMDDTCDAYATFPEAKNLIDSVQRWDLGAIQELPSFSKIVIQTILETMEEIEKEMKPRGRSASVQQTINEIKSLGKAYLAISKWARAGQVPTFDEYMEVGLVTAGMDDYAAYSFIGMEDCDEKQTNKWFDSKPKVFQALNTIYRVSNDIASFEVEMRRGELVNGINCYMKQYNVTKEHAIKELKKMWRDNYKIVIEEFLNTTSVPRQILVRCLNIPRVIDVYYKEGTDDFTNPHGNIEDHITSLLLHPIPL